MLQFWFLLLAMTLVAGVTRIVADGRGSVSTESKIDTGVRALLKSRVPPHPAVPTDSGSLESQMLLLSLVFGAYAAMASAAWSVLARKKSGCARPKERHSIEDGAESDESLTPADIDTSTGFSFMPGAISSSAISPPKKKQSLNMAAEIRTYVRTLGARVISSYQKLKVQLHQSGLNETDAALEFARRHFAVENFDGSALPSNVDPAEFCRCVQGPILDRPRKYSFLAPDVCYPHSWMPPGFRTSEGPWTGVHLPGVGKRLASAIIAHFQLDASTNASTTKAASVIFPVQRPLQSTLPLPTLLRDVMLALPEQRSRARRLTLEMLQPISQWSTSSNGHALTPGSPSLLVCVLLHQPSSNAAPFWARHASTLLQRQPSADGAHNCTQWGVLHASCARPQFTPEHLQQCIDEGILAILVAEVLTAPVS
jgi:hypothetical protein